MATCNASTLLTDNPFTELDPGLMEAVKLQLLCDISASGGGGGTIGGSGTAGRLAKFTAGTTLGDSIITESGTTISVAGSLNVASSGSLGWSDVVLVRSAANVLALRNGTAAQSLLINNTFTSSTNFERGFLSWVSNEFRIGTEKGSGGGSARDVVIHRDGSAVLTCTSSGVSVAGNITSSGTGVIGPSGRGGIRSSANGTLRLSNSADTDFDRLQFGGTTSSFPAIKRNAATLECKLADDSAFAMFAAEFMSITDGITAPAAVAGRARIYVDTADGDLKVVFGDGTVKTIVTDT